jgi:uncharacterized protein
VIAFDTNIVVHSANEDSPHFERAREFLENLGSQRNVVVCELMLVEVFLKLCNGKIFQNPMSPAAAGAYCRALRNNQNWRLVEVAPVMPEVWEWTGKRGFAFRRIIDLRLGLTLRHFGVTEFASTNGKDFRGLGFARIWNPLVE